MQIDPDSLPSDPSAIADLLGELERIRALLWHSLTAPASPPVERSDSRVLTPQQAAKRLGRGVTWVYRNRRRLPVVELARR